MTATNSAGAAKAASANGKLRPAHGRGDPRGREAHLANIIAQHMAEGCPSVVEAARRMRITLSDAERLWTRIRCAMGRQAL